MEIGRVIRQRGLRTAVSHTIFEPVTAKDTLSARYAKGACASACTYAFLGGVERMIDETSIGAARRNTPRLRVSRK